MNILSVAIVHHNEFYSKNICSYMIYVYDIAVLTIYYLTITSS